MSSSSKQGLSILLIVTMAMIRVLAAQDRATPQPGPATAPVEPTNAAPHVLLKAGTEVKLRFAQRLRSTTAVIGDPVELTLDQDLMAGDAIVAHKGARVLAKVASGKTSEKKRAGVKIVSIAFDYLRVGNQKIPLQGQYSAQAKVNKGAAIAATAAFGVSGLVAVMANKHSEVVEGTVVTAYVANDTELSQITPP